MIPTARTNGLTTKKLADELVVFDATTGSVHFLNRVAEVVWRSCDGRTDSAALARIVGRSAGVPDAGPAVELALEQLSRRGLLASPVERADADRRRDRRQALKQLATALAIPTVLTMTAGKARAQLMTGQPCEIKCPDGSTTKGVVAPGGLCSGPACPESTGLPPASCAGRADGAICASGTCCHDECQPFTFFLNNPANCGTCGHVCPTPQQCVGGTCVAGQG